MKYCRWARNQPTHLQENVPVCFITHERLVKSRGSWGSFHTALFPALRLEAIKFNRVPLISHWVTHSTAAHLLDPLPAKSSHRFTPDTRRGKKRNLLLFKWLISSYVSFKCVIWVTGGTTVSWLKEEGVRMGFKCFRRIRMKWERAGWGEEKGKQPKKNLI